MRVVFRRTGSCRRARPATVEILQDRILKLEDGASSGSDG